MVDPYADRFSAHDDRSTAQDDRMTEQDDRMSLADDHAAGLWLASDERRDWQDKIARLNYITLYRRLRAIGIGLCIGLLCTGLALTTALAAARNANNAADEARKAGDCSALLLESVAQRNIDNAAVAGCDVRAAIKLIDAAKARDAAVKARDEEDVRVTCDLLDLFVRQNAPELREFREQFRCPSL